MQIRKAIAVGAGALLAGATLAVASLGADLSNVFPSSDISSSALTGANTLVVIGSSSTSPAYAKDVVGAIDVAATLGGTTTETVTSETTSTTVSNGVNMKQSGEPLSMWDNLASAKTTLTKSDLPTELASKSYIDANSVGYDYSQYLEFTNAANNGRVVYDRPSGETEPKLGVRFASTGTATVYNYKLVFTKQFSSGAANSNSMDNTNIDILGKTYTITDATNTTAKLTLTMLAGKNSKTVTSGTPVTFTVSGKDYKVELVATGTEGGTDAAILKVNSESLQIKTGFTKESADGTLVGVTNIFKATKEAGEESATIFVGADKVELSDTDITDASYDTSGFKLNGKTVDNVEVKISGEMTTAVKVNTIEVRYRPTTETWIYEGKRLTDPAFGAFDILFNGIAPAINDVNSDEISVTTSTITASTSFPTKTGETLTQTFAKAASSDVTLVDAAGYAIKVVEGALIAQNEYQVVSQGGFGHLLQLSSSTTSSSSTTKFKDVASGDTIEITGGNTTMYLDGQAYYVFIPSANSAYITWGSGAAVGSLYTGNITTGSITVFPYIETTNGAKVAFTDNNVTALSRVTTSTTYYIETPTGEITAQYWLMPVTGVGNSGVQFVGDSTETNLTVTNGASKVVLKNGARYNFTVYNESANITMTASIDKDQTASNDLAIGYPGLLIQEERDEDNAYNVLLLGTYYDTANDRIKLYAPVFTSTVTSNPTVGTTNENRYVDVYGTYVSYDSTNQGKVLVYYPTAQSESMIGVGKDVTFGTSVSGTAVKSAVPVLNPVGKMDSEITTTVKSDNNLILVGGPCANTLVKEVLTTLYPTSATDCVSLWKAALGVNATESTTNMAIIKYVKDAFVSGKAALIVAGDSGDDTRVACAKVQKDGLTGTEKIWTTTATGA